jgi:hypothetical protein
MSKVIVTFVHLENLRVATVLKFREWLQEAVNGTTTITYSYGTWKASWSGGTMVEGCLAA